MKRRLEMLWAKSGRIQVSDMANSFFLVRFSDAEDYNRASFKGPWKISVNRIGNYIGKTVRLDLATSEGARARYARVCVELDLTKPLLGKYMIEDRVYHVEYESIENICYGCGKYGLKLASCSTCNPIVPVATPEAQPPPNPPQAADEGATGSWMIVGRRQKKKSSTPKQPRPGPKESGSRFDILSQDSVEPTAAVKAPSVQIPERVSPTENQKSTNDHAEALARVLQKAFQTDEVVNKQPPQDTSTSADRAPLTDLTNKGKRVTQPSKPFKSKKGAATPSQTTTSSAKQSQ
ncbi:hypothetical protein LINPERHAP2_LOCUS41269 [Linum perenne]